MNWSVIKDLFDAIGLHIGFALVLIVSFSAYREYKKYTLSKKTVRQEQLQVFIEVLSGAQNKNGFIVEQAFENKFDYPLSFNEINYFLKFPNPTEMLRKYISSRRYFSFDLEKNRPVLTGLASSKIKLLRFWYLSVYFTFGVSSLMSIPWLIKIMEYKGPIGFLVASSFAVYLVFLALLCLNTETRISDAVWVSKNISNFKSNKTNCLY